MASRTAGGWLVGAGLLASTLGTTSGRGVQAGESRAKVAITSSLASAADQIRQRAFDGKADTFFASAGPAKGGDDLTLTFDAPATVRVIEVATGRPDGTDKLSAGSLEISADGATFERVAGFPATGVARVEVGDRPLRALRIRAQHDLPGPLVVREFGIESDRVKPFEHPVEFAVAVEDAADLQTWTEATARLCEQWYDALAAELDSPGFRPTDQIALTMKRNYRGVAAAGNGRITGSARYFETHRDDQGAFIHETVHVIQAYKGQRRNPGWLVEGVADWVRFYVYEPGKAGRVDPEKARYDASYRTTAAFLDYLARTHDKEIVRKLNRAMREGTYDKAIFEQLCGKPVEALDADWRASLPR